MLGEHSDRDTFTDAVNRPVTLFTRSGYVLLSTGDRWTMH